MFAKKINIKLYSTPYFLFWVVPVNVSDYEEFDISGRSAATCQQWKWRFYSYSTMVD